MIGMNPNDWRANTPTGRMTKPRALRVLGGMLLLALVPGATLGAETATPKPTNLVLHAQSEADAQPLPALKLRGPDACQQLLATARLDNGAQRDFTRQVSFTATPANVVSIGKDGRLLPLGNGTATVTAKSADGLTASLPVTVENFTQAAPINFAKTLTRERFETLTKDLLDRLSSGGPRLATPCGTSARWNLSLRQ